MIRSALPTSVLLMVLTVAAQAQTPPADAGQDAAAKVLLDQANYWRAQFHLDQAEQAIRRLLRLEPDNPDALAMLAEFQAERGDRIGAQATLARLQAVRANDPRIAAVQQAIRRGRIDPVKLAEARRLTQEGHYTGAVAHYRRLFHGSEPPKALAIEYYSTLAGTKDGWAKARAGLARMVTVSPHDLQAQLAYAELLTYHEQTRAEGIARLGLLAKIPSMAVLANKVWRQALQWLPVDKASIPDYQDWLKLHPHDAVIAGLLDKAQHPPRSPADILAAKRSAAFAALQAGKLDDAEAGFQAVLDKAPHDAAALGGLGLVRLRQGKNHAAHDLLSRAIAADPAHKNRWESALAGASIGEQYASAHAEVQHGRWADAERDLRAIIAHGSDVSGARQMLGDALRQRGDLPGAEQQYRAVLAQQPNNADAMVALAETLEKLGRGTEAEALLDRAERAGNTRAVGRIRANTLREQAATISNPATKEALLRAAVAAQPNDPWTRLDLARVLSVNGHKAEARAVMQAVTAVAHPSIEALRAGALFAAEDNRPRDAAALIDRLPPAARTPQLRALLANANLLRQVHDATALAAVNPGAAREKLLTLAAHADPDGSRGIAVARAFLRMHDPAGAREALATAQAATHTPTAAQRIAYAGILLQAGDSRSARMLVNSLNGATGLTAQQTADLNRLRSGMAIRDADALNAEGRQADAYDVLAPVLASMPDDPALNMAVARLYSGADEPGKALAVNDALLARDPSNVEARQAAVNAAIQAQDWSRADRLVHEGLQLTPDDPRAWMMSAALNRAQGNDRGALQNLRQAQSLRRQQIDVDRPLPYRSGSAVRPQQPAQQTAMYLVSEQDASLLPLSGNPFRRDDAGAQPSPETPQQLATPTPRDPMLNDINRQIVSLQDDLAPKLTVGPSFRSRTGTNGLDALDEASLPTELEVRPFGRGQLTVDMTPTFLSAGEVPADTKSQESFGTGAFGTNPTPPNQHAQGVGFSLTYRLGWLKADVGTSPIGFQQENLLGGVELSPQVANGLRLRVGLERRAVTDSVLSYAGTQDPATGTNWGGVTRTRGHAQLELSVRNANFYLGGSYSLLDGTNVASNREYEFGTGGSYQIWHGKGDELRIGIDMVYFAYNRNLRYFSLGQGGYFSPQSYFATMLPVHYTSKSDALNWSVGVALGYQTYSEQSSPMFPNDPGLQTVSYAAAGATPGLMTAYPGRSASELVGGADGTVEYRISDTLRLGGRASYQHAGDWSETSGTLFARYIFSGGLW